MEFTDLFDSFLGLLHTLIRFLPLGIYFFAYFSSSVYKDIRSAILLGGLVINELFGFLYRKQNPNSKPNDSCAIFGKTDDDSELGFMNNSHTEFMSFVASFYFSDMYYKQKLDVLPFTTLLSLLFITIWSRMSIKCENSKQVIYNLIIGVVAGVIFYYFVKDYYLQAERNLSNVNQCDLGYDNYKCTEIKDGQVVIKDNE